MEVSYATMEAMGILVQRLGQNARRLEKALAETMNASAEWKRIADELKAERDAAKQEAMLARQRIDGLMIQAQDMRAEIERLKKPARQHPVKVGEWVKRTKFAHSEGTKINTIAQVVGYDPDGDYLVSVAGSEHCWRPSNCTPCDPPEATHDTPEGRSVAEAAARHVRRFKAGSTVRLINTPPEWDSEWGTIGDTGTVSTVFACDTGVRIRETGFEWPADCIESVAESVIRNDRNTEPKPGDTVRLVRKPTQADLWGQVGQTDTVIKVFPDAVIVSSLWSWPISCIEIVEDAK